MLLQTALHPKSRNSKCYCRQVWPNNAKSSHPVNSVSDVETYIELSRNWDIDILGLRLLLDISNHGSGLRPRAPATLKLPYYLACSLMPVEATSITMCVTI
jgi:hypothetical protein